jgi:hypothetical protein
MYFKYINIILKSIIVNFIYTHCVGIIRCCYMDLSYYWLARVQMEEYQKKNSREI